MKILRNYSKPDIDTETIHYIAWPDLDGWVGEGWRSGKTVYILQPRKVAFIRKDGKWDANVYGEE